MAKVVLENVSKRFDGTAVVRDVDLVIHDKEFLVLVGPSGCGKTTTLRMIAGLEEITSGEIYIGDRLVNEVAPKDRDIAMVFQNYALYPHMNVYDNMAFGLRIRGIAKKEIDQRVNEAAEILGLKDLMQRFPKQLSGGQRQRVALGRAIVRKPMVFLMDEPLSNLDAKLRVQMRAELKKIHTRLQATIVYVTHDQVEAMTLGDRIAVMVLGEVQQVDRPTIIYEKPSNRFVAGFIGSPPMNFVKGELQPHDGQVAFHSENFSLPLPRDFISAVSRYVGKKVMLGIRPEDIVDEGRASLLPERQMLHCRVDFRELMGSETNLYLKVGTTQLVARVDAMNDARSGMELNMVVNVRKIHMFDGETQNVIL